MPGQSLCYGRGLCENFLNIPYSLRAKKENNKTAKSAGAEGDGCFPAGAPLVGSEKANNKIKWEKFMNWQK